MASGRTNSTLSSRKPTSRKVVGTLAALTTAVAAHGQTVLFVDDDAPPGGDGRSWNGAFSDLQDALLVASLTWEETEIRIAEGIYTPDRGTGIRSESFGIDHIGNVSSSSTLGFGIILKGAFAGIKALDPNERDTQRFKSVLSGDLNGDDLPGFGNTGDNSYHIFELTATAHSEITLDGLVFQGGNAAGSPTETDGGALKIALGRSLPLPLSIIDCVFIDNRAKRGGAITMGSLTSPALISRCFFGNNQATLFGGALFNDWTGNAVVSNCVFSGNTAADRGGAIYSITSTQFVECTFYGNTTGRGTRGAICSSNRTTSIANSIFFSNGDLPLSASETEVSYSCIEGGFAGVGNIDLDPVFTNPLGDDGILGTPDDNFLPRFGSPVIDAGNNSLIVDPGGVDFAGNTRMVDDRFTPDTGFGTSPIVDMGAYEFQPPQCYADLDQTTGVGVLDLLDFLRFQHLFFLNDPLACQVDRSTGSNICDMFDFLAFQSEFVAGCS